MKKFNLISFRSVSLFLVHFSLLFFQSCKKATLEIQQDFPFEVRVMPVPKTLAKGETVELRITIASEGNYKGTEYYIRYFQNDGTGILKDEANVIFMPNNRYFLQEKEFRLFYSSMSAVSQTFDVWISDNFENEQKLSFYFNSEN